MDALRLARLVAPAFVHEHQIRRDAAAYDMCSRPEERFYAELYLGFIAEAINEWFSRNERTDILDAGCGQGRITIPLALMGHSVTGVDFAKETIATARRNAEGMGVQPTFILANLREYLAAATQASFDCVICLEVLYMLADHEQLLAGLVSALKPGGLLALSVRPKLFYVLHSLRRQRSREALAVAAQREGRMFGGRPFNWFTAKELSSLLARLEIEHVNLYGIGLASGIEGDPQALFSRPSLLGAAERARLLEMERLLAPAYPDSGRYMLALGVKRRPQTKKEGTD